MKISENVIFSEKMKFRKRILRRFRNNKIIPGVFVIRLAAKPDQLEIIRADFLKQKFLRDEDSMVVAFASGYDAALELVLDITDKAIQMYGEPDIRAYVTR